LTDHIVPVISFAGGRTVFMVISIEPLDAVGQGEPPSAVRAVSRIARDDEMNEFGPLACLT